MIVHDSEYFGMADTIDDIIIVTYDYWKLLEHLIVGIAIDTLSDDMVMVHAG